MGVVHLSARRYDVRMDQKKKYIFAGIGLSILIGGGYVIYRDKVEQDLIPGGVPVQGAVSPSGVPLFDPESVGNVVRDSVTGREYLSNQVIVEFLPDVSEQESLNIISEVGGTMLQRFTIAPLFLIQVKDTGDGKGAARLIDALNTNTKVKKADRNYLTTLDASAAQ